MKHQTELDKKISVLNKRKAELYRLEDTHKIPNKQYEEELKQVNTSLRELIVLKMDEINNVQKTQETARTQSEQKITTQIKTIKKKKLEHSNVGRKTNKKSYTSLIIKALTHPKIDNEDKVVAVVNAWKPGTHKQNIRKQVKNTISSIKQHKQKRFKKLEWDEKTYKVNKTCQTTLI